MPARVPLEQGLALAADLGDAEQQVLGRDVLVAEPARLGLGALDDALGARVERQRAALDPGAPGEDRRELAAERGQVDAEAAERLGRDAVVGLDERATGGARRRGSGCASRSAVAWAARMASWAFWVKRSSCIGWSRVRSGQRGSGWSTRSRKRAGGRASPRRRGRSAGRPGP